MPVIRGRPTATVFELNTDRRNEITQKLKNEIAGQHESDGPVIFEIPLEHSDERDVLVVWQEFQGIRSEDRTQLILDSYNDQHVEIAQALGVTYREAMDQNLLPYAVIPMVRRTEVVADLRDAMLEQGGIPIPPDKVDLRFPTMEMAEAAHRSLCELKPKGYWSISQSLAQIL